MTRHVHHSRPHPKASGHGRTTQPLSPGGTTALDRQVTRDRNAMQHDRHLFNDMVPNKDVNAHLGAKGKLGSVVHKLNQDEQRLLADEGRQVKVDGAAERRLQGQLGKTHDPKQHAKLENALTHLEAKTRHDESQRTQDASDHVYEFEHRDMKSVLSHLTNGKDWASPSDWGKFFGGAVDAIKDTATGIVSLAREAGGLVTDPAERQKFVNALGAIKDHPERVRKLLSAMGDAMARTAFYPGGHYSLDHGLGYIAGSIAGPKGAGLIIKAFGKTALAASMMAKVGKVAGLAGKTAGKFKVASGAGRAARALGKAARKFHDGERGSISIDHGLGGKVDGHVLAARANKAIAALHDKPVDLRLPNGRELKGARLISASPNHGLVIGAGDKVYHVPEQDLNKFFHDPRNQGLTGEIGGKGGAQAARGASGARDPVQAQYRGTNQALNELMRKDDWMHDPKLRSVEYIRKAFHKQEGHYKSIPEEQYQRSLEGLVDPRHPTVGEASGRMYGPAFDKGQPSPDWTMFRGNLPKGATESRLYANLDPGHAASFSKELMNRLDHAGIKYDYKIPRTAMGYESADNAVLYTSAQDAAKAREIAQSIVKGHPDWTREGVPSFTRPVGKGLAEGAEPKGGESSIGISRSKALAKTFAWAQDHHVTSAVQVRDHLDEVLKQMGIDPAKPWQNLG